MKKIFLTVLGTGGYSDCFYYQDEKEIRTKFVQEALIRLILRKDSDNE